MATAKGERPRSRSRARRVVSVLFRLLVGLAALGLLLGVVAARHLGHPLVKGPIAALAFRIAGADIDLADGALGLESLTLSGLRVKHPAGDDARVGDLLRLDRLEVRWRLDVVASGERRLERVVAEGLALGLVLGGEGGSSLARAVRLPAPTTSDEPIRPTRWLRAALQPQGAAIDTLIVGPTTLSVAHFADPQARLVGTLPRLEAELDLLATPSRWKAQLAGPARLNLHAGTLAELLTAQAIAVLRGLETELALRNGAAAPAAQVGATAPADPLSAAARLERLLRPPWQADALLAVRVAPRQAGPGAGVDLGVELSAPSVSAAAGGAALPTSARWLSMQVEVTTGQAEEPPAVAHQTQLVAEWTSPALGAEASAQIVVTDAALRDVLPTAVLTRAEARLLRRADAAQLKLGPIALELGADSAAKASVAAWPLWPWWTPSSPAASATPSGHGATPAPSARFELELPAVAVSLPAIAVGLPASATGADSELRASAEGVRLSAGATMAARAAPTAGPRMAVLVGLSLGVDAAALTGAGVGSALRGGGASLALELEVAQAQEGLRWMARLPQTEPVAPGRAPAASRAAEAQPWPTGPAKVQVSRLAVFNQRGLDGQIALGAPLPLAGTLTDLRCELVDLAVDVTAGAAALGRLEVGCGVEALALRAAAPSRASSVVTSLELAATSGQLAVSGATIGLAGGEPRLAVERLRVTGATLCPRATVRGEPAGLRRLRAEATLVGLHARGADLTTAQLSLASADLQAEGDVQRLGQAACDPRGAGVGEAGGDAVWGAPEGELRASLGLRQLSVAADAPDAMTVTLRGELTAPGAKAGASLSIDDHVAWQAELEVAALRRLLADLGLAPRELRAAGTLSATTRGRATGHRSWLRAALGDGHWPAAESLRLQHQSRLRQRALSGTKGAARVNLHELLVEAEGEGSGLRQTQRVNLTLDGVRVAASALPTIGLQAVLTTRATGGARAALLGLDVDVRLDAAGRPALEATLALTKGQPWQLEAETTLHPVGALAGRVASPTPCLELGRIGATAKGVVRLFAPDTWAPTPLLAFVAAPRRWHLEADVSGSVRDLRCHLAGFDADAPEARGRLQFEVRAGQVHGKVEGSLERLRAVVRAHALDFRKLRGQAEISAPLAADLRGAHIDAKAQLGALRQDLLPFYAVEEASAALTAEIDAHGRVRIERLLAQNKGGGSGLRLDGVIDRVGEEAILGALGDDGVPGSRGVALRGEASQDLDAIGEAFGAKLAGRVRLPFEIESGDLRTFAVALRPQLDGVSAQHARLGLAVREVRGVVPTTFVVRVDERGVRPLGGGERSAWSRWRFADHHPFVGGEHFLSVGELTFREHRFGPLAANASIDRDVVRLDQMELRLLGGQVTGSCQIELQGADSQVTLRGNATDLRLPDQPGRFDANAAIVLRPWRLSIEGRAQLLRATPGHLRGLLDLADPYHEDVQANRARLLLTLGHPDEVRMRFRHGFMDLYIALAGLAELVHIDEIRGLPLGPMMARWAVPLLGEPPP